MSRIYEALQKAESERKLERQERELRTPVEQLDVESAPAPAAVAEYEAVPHYTEPQFTTTAEDLPIAGGLNMAEVRRLPWNLAVDRLPALLDRGPSIEQFRSLRSR